MLGRDRGRACPRSGSPSGPTDIGTLQAIAAVGQPRLLERMSAILGAHDLVAGQVLLTPYDFVHRSQYLHARETLQPLLDLGVLPDRQRERHRRRRRDPLRRQRPARRARVAPARRRRAACCSPTPRAVHRRPAPRRRGVADRGDRRGRRRARGGRRRRGHRAGERRDGEQARRGEDRGVVGRARGDRGGRRARRRARRARRAGRSAPSFAPRAAAAAEPQAVDRVRARRRGPGRRRRRRPARARRAAAGRCCPAGVRGVEGDVRRRRRRRDRRRRRRGRSPRASCRYTSRRSAARSRAAAPPTSPTALPHEVVHRDDLVVLPVNCVRRRTCAGRDVGHTFASRVVDGGGPAICGARHGRRVAEGARPRRRSSATARPRPTRSDFRHRTRSKRGLQAVHSPDDDASWSSGERAKAASRLLATASTAAKNAALLAAADLLLERAAEIQAANDADLDAAAAAGMDAGPLDRLRLTDARLDGHGRRAAHGRRPADPVGEVLDGWTPPERARDPAGAGAARRGRDHLREPAQRHQRRGRALPEVGQRGAPARLVAPRCARTSRSPPCCATALAKARAARGRGDPRRRHRRTRRRSR